MHALPLLAVLLAASPGSREAPEPPQRSRPSQPTATATVLLASPELPSADAIIAAHRKLAPGADLGPTRSAGGRVLLTLDFDDGGLLVLLVPTAVPDAEADEAFRRSLSARIPGRKLAEHRAHLVLQLLDEPGRSRRDSLVRFTYLVAAVARASKAVGVYWGEGSVTHDAEYFLDVVRAEKPEVLPVLWCGFGIAKSGSGRLSLLTYGLREQLGLMDLRVTGPREGFERYLRFAEGMVVYVVQRGADIPEGDTVGRDADERLAVRYEPSPIDPDVQVWRVDFP